MIKNIVRGIDWCFRIFEKFSKLTLGFLVALVSVEVIARLVFKSSITWAYEIALLLLVWVTFLSMAVGVSRNSFIALTLIYDKLGLKAQKGLDYLSYVFVLGFGAVLLIYGARLVMLTSRATLPASKLPTSAIYLMIPIVGFFIVFYSLLNICGLNKYRIGYQAPESEADAAQAESGGAAQDTTAEPKATAEE